MPIFGNPKKYRKYFPKKGAERKVLTLLPNLLSVPIGERKALYKKILSKKTGIEKERLVTYRRALKQRLPVLKSINQTVLEFQAKNPRFKGLILFGGVGKKLTPPTDLDVILVGELVPSEKKEFLNLLESRTGIFPDSTVFTLTPENARSSFLRYLSKETPYFSSSREWTIQNFFGPVEVKRQIRAAFNYARKELIKKNNLFSERK